MSNAWRTEVAPDWVPALDAAAEALARVDGFLRAELAAGRAYLPATDVVLRAFEQPLADVRVLIVGQDPYPTPGDAVGLSFSVAPDRTMPRSLANIARELRDDTGDELAHGDLSHWANQGVMLLNRVLTVRPGEPGSHRQQGWEDVTAAAIEALASRGGPLVAILWGRDAQSLASTLAGATVIQSAHPSPLSASRGFFGSHPFSRANDALARAGAPPIEWGTPTGRSSSPTTTRAPGSTSS